MRFWQNWRRARQPRGHGESAIRHPGIAEKVPQSPTQEFGSRARSRAEEGSTYECDSQAEVPRQEKKGLRVGPTSSEHIRIKGSDRRKGEQHRFGRKRFRQTRHRLDPQTPMKISDHPVSIMDRAAPGDPA